MITRLGRVFYLTACILAGTTLLFGVYLWWTTIPKEWGYAVLGLVIAAAIWLLGRAAKDVLEAE
jgi:uncharacterized BrkB/YihY/UPF0761 family membrane protein